MLELLKDTNYQIIPRRWILISISAVVILAGLISLVVRGGPNYGIDFQGGYKFIVKFSGPAELARVREVVNGLGYSHSQVQDFGSEHEVVIVLPLEEEIAATGGTDPVQARLGEALRANFPVAEISQEKVGPKIGSELRTQALWSIFYSLLGLIVYITWRFEFRFSIAAIVALIHNVIIMIGFFSLLNKQIDLTVLGALLTLVGYSINDTIVVFDRIRENLRSHRRGQSYAELVNASINQTLSRTIVTGGSVLIVVAMLFLFGGAVIHDFAFTLFVGTLVGTYSSIFIASPILVEWQAASQRRRERRLATA
ncbi:protein translocase subunit SecF [bacterium]|nr:protein translocase subunit SecF [bacterium]